MFTSDRENQSNLFRYDLDTGLITQMTDLQGGGRPSGCVSTVNHALYFGWKGAIYELDLETLEERVVWEPEPPMQIRGRANPTADGKYVCTMLGEARKREGPARISFSYSGFREAFAAKPLTQIVRVELATGKMEVLLEERCYMGHLNTSPVLPDILTYCHEGPWNLVDSPRSVGRGCGA